MYIAELKLQNYRKFEEISIEFDRQLSVLVGKNGSGKTSVLEALTISLGTFFFSIDGISAIGIRPSDAMNRYFMLGEDVDVQKQFPVKISAKGIVDGQSMEWTRTLNTLGGKTTSIYAKDMTGFSAKCQERLMRGDASLKLPILAYYGTGRLWDDHREKWSGRYKQNTRINGYIDCLDGRANVKLLLDWFKRMTMKNGNNGKNNEAYIAVKGAMEHCFSRLTGIEDVRVLVNPDTFAIEIEYRLDEKGSVKIPLEQLSDGYRCALSLIGDIAYRMATLNPQLSGEVLKETEGVVLIDEVDLHLHPEWQQRILTDLVEIFPKVQFIVTTHAPAIINSTPRGELLVIDGDDVEYLGNDAYGSDLNTVVESYMDAGSRPQEIKMKYKEFYEALDEEEILKAKKVLEELENKIDVHDPELAACRVKYSLAEHRKR